MFYDLNWSRRWNVFGLISAMHRQRARAISTVALASLLCVTAVGQPVAAPPLQVRRIQISILFTEYDS